MGNSDKAFATPTIDELLETEGVYKRLMEFERELDYRIARKQAQIGDASRKAVKVKRILRLVVSHFFEKDMIKDEQQPQPASSLTIRVEGKLEAVGRASKSTPKPFSHYIRSILIQIDKESDTVEWTKTSTSAETEGFEIRRKVAKETLPLILPIRIIFRLDEQPERYLPSKQLSQIVGEELVSKPAAVLSIWQYAKRKALQVSDEKKMVRCDEVLQSIVGSPQLSFTDIPRAIEPHLLPAAPLEVLYELRSDRSEDSAIWDFEVDVDDPNKTRSMAANIVAQQREIGLLEHRIHDVQVAMKASAMHQLILKHFAEDPVGCLKRLLDAQCADHAALLDEPDITIDDLEKASNFDTEEVEQLVSLYLANESKRAAL